MNLQERIQSALIQFPVVETKRLLLKRVEPEDTEQLFQLHALCGAEQLIGRVVPSNTLEASLMQLKVKEDLAAGKTISWVASLKELGTVIGSCSFSNIDTETGYAEFSGEMSSSNWGKYYAVEGTLAIVSFGLNKLHFSSINSLVAPDNISAIYLLEKLGFKEENISNPTTSPDHSSNGMLRFSRKNSTQLNR